VSVAVEGHVRVGFCRAQTAIEVQVPLEERSGASKVDVQVQMLWFIVGPTVQLHWKVSVLHVKFLNCAIHISDLVFEGEYVQEN